MVNTVTLRGVGYRYDPEAKSHGSQAKRLLGRLAAVRDDPKQSHDRQSLFMGGKHVRAATQ